MITKFKQEDYQMETNAARAGSFIDEIGAHSEPIYLSSSFRFKNAAQAAARFQGKEDGFVYSRFANPTVQIFEQRIAALENGQWCVATATGMSAILTTCIALLKKGDQAGIHDNLLRISVGLENLEDIRKDLESAFNYVSIIK